MRAADVRAAVEAGLRTVQGTKHHLGLVTLQVLTDRVTEAVAPLMLGTTVPAAEAEVLPKADVVAWLVKKAREERAGSTRDDRVRADVIGVLASKVERGAVRPDNLRMLPADFFEPGHTYTHTEDETDWKFRVDTVTTHPEDGERTALGWRHFRGEWEPYAYGEDDYDVHQHVGLTDVIEGGAR